MTAYICSPSTGQVIGAKGRPVGRIGGRGYVVLKSSGRIVAMAHRLIWESVHGPIPDGMQINHINGVKHDNRISNLELVTPSENTKHAYAIGLRSAAGECNGRARLTKDDVLRIRASSMRPADLAASYGVSPSTIRDVLSRKRWKHLG